MVFVRELVKAGSVGFVEDAVEHVGLFFFVAKKAGAQRFIVNVRASNRHFLRPPSGPLFTGEGLWHVEFQGAPEDALNWFVGSADINNAFHQMRFPGLLQAFFALPAVLASEVGNTERNDRTATFCSRFFEKSCPYNTSDRFSWAMFFCQDVTDHCTVEGSADSLPFVCRDNSTPPLLGSKHGLGSAGFHQWYADNFGVLARGANCTHNHLARLIAGAQKAGLDVHDVVHASGSADVLGYEVSPANSCCGGAGKQKSCMRSVGRTVSSRRRISSRAMEFVSGHESFVALSNRGDLSILNASFKFPRASYLVTVEPWSTVRLQQRACGGILCLLRSDWSLRWLDVCVCADPSEKCFAFAVREGCRELASEVGRFSEQTRFERTSKSIRARSRHFIPSLRKLVLCVQVQMKMPGMEIGGVPCFLSRGKHHNS